MLVFRFYSEGEGAYFEERRYKNASMAPPVPRFGEKVALGEEMFLVVESPAHYFERVHEIALVVKPIELVDAEDLQPQGAKSTSATSVPLNAQGQCAYCGDPECPGGEDCNFYDGSMG